MALRWMSSSSTSRTGGEIDTRIPYTKLTIRDKTILTFRNNFASHRQATGITIGQREGMPVGRQGQSMRCRLGMRGLHAPSRKHGSRAK